MLRPTFAVVDSDAIRTNLARIRSLLRPQTRLLCAVKANGYGHGAVAAARAAIAGGASDLGVATVEEALTLRDAGIQAPILVLGATSAQGVAVAAARGIAVTIGDLQEVEDLLAADWVDADHRGPAAVADVHLKIDTGMTRLGVRSARQAVALAQRITAHPRLRLVGAFTHLACADAPELGHAAAQVARFRERLSALAEAGLRPPLMHAANSAAALRRPDWQFDMVRVGIAAYGYGPAGVYHSPVPLLPALHLYSCITRVATIDPGESVGYGATFVAQQSTRVATVPIGYADGYFRTLSNRASVLVHGQRAPVIGNICMDQLMIDVTGIPRVQAGDCVTLYGRSAPEQWTAAKLAARSGAAQETWLAATFRAQPDAPVLSLDELADAAGTISYELMCALSPRIPRTVLSL